MLYYHRDKDFPGQDMGVLYASDIEAVCQRLKSRGKKPGAFIAESLQSVGGQIIYPKNYLREAYR